VTIRAKLYVAILLTVLGPVITTAVALHGMNRLGDRFDEVQERSEQRALALDLKFGVTDFNGWQTAYGYDGGASRDRFERSVRRFRTDLDAARNELTDPRETRLLNDLRSDVGMEWVPEEMWFTHMPLEADAGELDYDLAVSTDDDEAPAVADAGIPAREAVVVAADDGGVAWWPVAVGVAAAAAVLGGGLLVRLLTSPPTVAIRSQEGGS